MKPPETVLLINCPVVERLPAPRLNAPPRVPASEPAKNPRPTFCPCTKLLNAPDAPPPIPLEITVLSPCDKPIL